MFTTGIHDIQFNTIQIQIQNYFIEPRREIQSFSADIDWKNETSALA